MPSASLIAQEEEEKLHREKDSQVNEWWEAFRGLEVNGLDLADHFRMAESLGELHVSEAELRLVADRILSLQRTVQVWVGPELDSSGRLG